MEHLWEFPVVQWLGLGTFTARGLGSNPDWGRFYWISLARVYFTADKNNF